MKAYIAYKEWWIRTQSQQYIPSLYYGETPESAFQEHIKRFSLYELMETLVDWEPTDED